MSEALEPRREPVEEGQLDVINAEEVSEEQLAIGYIGSAGNYTTSDEGACELEVLLEDNYTRPEPGSWL